MLKNKLDQSMSSDSEATRPEYGGGKLRRVVGVVAVIFVAWHVFATFLWVSPVNYMRDAIPGNALTSYMIPMFGQSWSVFAPVPINGNYSFKVQAEVKEADGELRETEWVDAVEVEMQGMHMQNLFPPRAGTLALQQASSFKGAWEKLTADQKAIVKLGYYSGEDWRLRLETKMLEYPPTDAVDGYIAQEKLTTAYATQVAKAVWGDSVEHVRFEISRQNIAPFAQRHDTERKPEPVQLVPTGWRGLETMPGQSDQRFAEIFKPLYAKLDNGSTP
jgi:hypothetical protein